jgi:zinc D-Ala-D-Ala dipeptidase
MGILFGCSKKRYMRKLYILLFIFCITACGRRQQVKNYIAGQYKSIILKPAKSAMALYFDSLGLVDVTSIDSSILVRLMYAGTHNFVGKKLYEHLNVAYLHPNAAKALGRAAALLRRKKPQYRLVVCDAARPMSVQQEMWNVVSGTRKSIYVSNPAHGGGLHNYGLAVDITLADMQGHELPMGTKVDYMGYAAHTSRERQMLKSGRITRQEFKNRRLLRSVMKAAGFRVLPTEWWHFNYCSRAVARRHYHVIL